jgi:hypothetical protein
MMLFHSTDVIINSILHFDNMFKMEMLQMTTITVNFNFSVR